MSLRSSPFAVYLIFSAASALFFAAFGTLSSVYRFQAGGLDPLQLILIGTVLEGTVFLFELPTGVVADTYGRKISVTAGMVLIGAGFILEGSLPVFATMLAAQALWGVGYTLRSGAAEAWISDEIGEEAAGRAFLRAAQVGQVAGLAGIGLAVLLGRIYLGLPLVAGGAGFLLLALFLLLAMPETGFIRREQGRRNPFRALATTVQEAVAATRGRPLLPALFAIAAIAGASSETFDRLWEAHLLTNFRFPPGPALGTVAWFGLINVVTTLLSLAVTEGVRRRVDTSSHLAAGRALLVIHGCLLVAVLGFGLAGDVWLALSFYGAAVLMRTLNAPLFAAWLNQGLPSRVRATVFSMAGQMDAFGQIAGGPLLGLVATGVGLRAGFVGAALLLLPGVLLYLRALRAPSGSRHPEGGDS